MEPFCSSLQAIILALYLAWGRKTSVVCNQSDTRWERSRANRSQPRPYILLPTLGQGSFDFTVGSGSWVQETWDQNTPSHPTSDLGEDFGAKPVEILAFATPTGYMLTSSGFPLPIWGIFDRFL